MLPRCTFVLLLTNGSPCAAYSTDALVSFPATSQSFAAAVASAPGDDQCGRRPASQLAKSRVRNRRRLLRLVAANRNRSGAVRRRLTEQWSEIGRKTRRPPDPREQVWFGKSRMGSVTDQVQPAASLRRCQLSANINVASFDCPYASMASTRARLQISKSIVRFGVPAADADNLGPLARRNSASADCDAK